MAPVFSAFDHSTYRNLTSQHLADVLSMPTSVLESLRMRGGVCVGVVVHAGLHITHSIIMGLYSLCVSPTNCMLAYTQYINVLWSMHKYTALSSVSLTVYMYLPRSCNTTLYT